MSEDRRQSRRHDCQISVRYARSRQCVRSGIALDLSLSGARLKLPDASTPTFLTLELGGTVEVLARAVWAERLPGGEQLVGVVFEGSQMGLHKGIRDLLWSTTGRAA